MLRLIVVFALGLWALQSAADATESSREIGPYTVHFTAFPSLFVPADIASRNGLVRAADRSLINIALQDRASGKAVPAEVTGTAKNLIQQLKPLSFTAIEETDAFYSIASLRHTNEEIFHFDITIDPEGPAAPVNLTFTRKLYRE